MESGSERNGLEDNAERLPWLNLWVVILLVALTAAVFAQSVSYGFINYDDDQYVYANPAVAEGLTTESFSWAFTSFYFSSWHPLTWLSHMGDVSVFGMKAGGHHFTSVVLHAINCVLLFFVLFRLTNAPWQSLAVAAFFAVHPLHVEPVVWVASRKDVLSTMFWLLCLLAYVAYARRGGIWRYFAVLLAAAAALMSKTMAITLPFTLLLIDWWPLQRLAVRDTSTWRQPLVEKIPLFVMAAGTALVTALAQRQGGALMPSDRLTFGARMANAAWSYVRYLEKTFWPVDLAPFYPHPAGSIAVWQVSIAVAALLGITAFAYQFRKSAPWMLMGWLWFTGTLIPVIGIVQTGSHAMADRFSYVPHIGLFIALVWTAGSFARRDTARRALITAATIGIIVLTALAWRQTRLWRDPVVLFEHSIAVAGPSGRMLNNLGNALLLQGETEPAINHFEHALELNPDTPNVRTNLGAAYLMEGRYNDAIHPLETAIRQQPDNAVALTNYAYALAQTGRVQEALEVARRAVEANPQYAKARALLDALEQGTSNH